MKGHSETYFENENMDILKMKTHCEKGPHFKNLDKIDPSGPLLPTPNVLPLCVSR
jgi:hypothetical protein